MPLIKNGAYVEDPYERVEGEAPLPDGGDVLIDWSRLKEDASITGFNGRLGVAFPNTADANELAPYLTRLSLVTLEFPSFTDGRGFSQARILRQQLAFKGEIRATGISTLIVDRNYRAVLAHTDRAAVLEKGQIVIPKAARDMFNIKPGDTLLLLADDKRGIAIVRRELFMEFTDNSDAAGSLSGSGI